MRQPYTVRIVSLLLGALLLLCSLTGCLAPADASSDDASTPVITGGTTTAAPTTAGTTLAPTQTNAGESTILTA